MAPRERHARGCTCCTDCQARTKLEALGMSTRQDRERACEVIAGSARSRAEVLISALNAEGGGGVVHGALQVAILANASAIDAEASAPALTRTEYLRRRAQGDR